jgi:hypothetical protein
MPVRIAHGFDWVWLSSSESNLLLDDGALVHYPLSAIRKKVAVLVAEGTTRAHQGIVGAK